MKIGQFSDSFLPIIDGVGRVVYNYCNTIARKGHECTAVVPLDQYGYRARYPFEIIDYYAKKVPIMSQYDAGLPPFDIHYNARMDMTSFDIVHVHTPFIAGFEGIKYARDRKIPIVGTFHSKYYDDFLQMTGSKSMAHIGTDMVIQFFNHCDEVWAVSESSGETLRSYGYKGELKIMPNGMDIKTVDPSWKEEAREYFNIPSGRPCLLFVGQINWKKNILRILEAASLLKKDGTDFSLILAGKGPHEKEIQDKIKELDIEDRTYMIGHVLKEQLLYGLYSLADLFIFPSIYDNAPMVVREAANAGTPSIVIEGSSSAEIIENNVSGFCCEDDSESLFETMKENLKDLDRTAMIGATARNTILTGWDEIIDMVLEEYQRLIDEHQK